MRGYIAILLLLATLAQSASATHLTRRTSTRGAIESNPANEETFVPPSVESFAHDADGNLTSDGRWNYDWDGENRLLVMRSKVGSPAPERRIEEYDYLGRRIRQTVWNDRDDAQGSEVSDVIYLYDRWNLVGELDFNNRDLCLGP